MVASPELRWLLRGSAEGLLRVAGERLVEFRASEAERRRALAQMRALLALLGEELDLVCFEVAFRALALARQKYVEDAQLLTAGEACAVELGAHLRLDDRLAVFTRAFEARWASENALFPLLAAMLREPAPVADGPKVLAALLSLLDRASSPATAEAATESLMHLLRQPALCVSAEAGFDVLQTAMGLKEASPSVPLLALMDLLAARSATPPTELLSEAAGRSLDALLANGCATPRQKAFFAFLLVELLPAVPALAAARLAEILGLAAGITARENDARARFEALAAVHALLVPALRPALLAHTATLLQHVLVEGLQWRAGKPTAQVRQAAVLCLTDAARLQLLDAAQVTAALPVLLPALKGCLNDDWAPDLRLQACELLHALVAAGLGGAELAREACPALLERMDDAQDPVRLRAAGALTVLAQSLGQALTADAQTQAVRTLLVHLDDANEQLHSAVFACLAELGRLQPAATAELARRAVLTARSPERPQRLLGLLSQ